MKRKLFSSCLTLGLSLVSANATLILNTDADATYRGADLGSPAPAVITGGSFGLNGPLLGLKTYDPGSLDPENSASTYSFVHFNLGAVNNTVLDAKLELEYALPGSSVAANGTITILGIVNGTSADSAWIGAANAPFSGTDIYTTAPGLVNLGTFTFNTTPTDGQVFTLTGSALVNFLNTDSNGQVTFAMVRDNIAPQGNNNFNLRSGNSLASPTANGFAGPQLLLEIAPEPGTYGLIAGGFCLALYGLRALARKKQAAAMNA